MTHAHFQMWVEYSHDAEDKATHVPEHVAYIASSNAISLNTSMFRNGYNPFIFAFE